MKAKHFISIIAIFFIMFLSGCSSYRLISKIEMKDKETIQIESGDFSYDGIKVVVFYSGGDTREIDLTEDMIPEVERLNFFKMGTHDIKVVYNERYSTTMKVKVVRHEFDDIYELEGYTCTFDGKPHKLELNYELPEGAEINYLYGNTFTNAGEYEVVGVITKNGYNSKTLRATLVIEKAEYDLSTVEFNDKETTFSGEPILIEATNVPEGIEVTYDVYNEDKTVRMNNAINAGKYVIVAKFSNTNENYKPIPNKEAKLTINKATYDMSNVALEEAEKDYDGNSYVAKLKSGSVLPAGVIVEFKYYTEEGTEVLYPTDAGQYRMVAKFIGNKTNYEDIKDIEAGLTINQKVIKIKDKLTFESMSTSFDREIHSLAVKGTLPDGVDLSYENNNQIYVGEYKVIAHFTCQNPNETTDLARLEAYLIINKINENVLKYNEATEEYEKVSIEDVSIKVNEETGEKTVAIDNLDTERYSIYKFKFTDMDSEQTVDIANLQNNKTYGLEVNIRFVNDDEDNSVILSPVTGEFTYHAE